MPPCPLLQAPWSWYGPEENTVKLDLSPLSRSALYGAKSGLLATSLKSAIGLLSLNVIVLLSQVTALSNNLWPAGSAT